MASLTRVELGILTSSSLRDPDQGETFLELLPDGYQPETYNDHEPINKPFTTVTDALSCWYLSFLWRRKKPRILGQVLFGSSRMHASVYISLVPKEFDSATALELFRRMCDTFSVDVAYIHICRSSDTANIDDYERFSMPFSQGLTTSDLRQGLPDLPWVLVFGKPYIDMLGDRLNTAPVHTLELIGDAVMLQLTEDHRDVGTAEYVRAQEAVKQYLNSRLFRTSDIAETYNVPCFRIQP